MKTLAKKCCTEQSPAQWRREVEKRLEPPTLPLWSYGGNELNLVKQIHNQCIEVAKLKSGS